MASLIFYTALFFGLAAFGCWLADNLPALPDEDDE